MSTNRPLSKAQYDALDSLGATRDDLSWVAPRTRNWLERKGYVVRSTTSGQPSWYRTDKGNRALEASEQARATREAHRTASYVLEQWLSANGGNDVADDPEQARLIESALRDLAAEHYRKSTR